MELKKFNWQGMSPSPVIGVDEVGRGCIAGPVYAAAIILNEEKDYSEYTDSKKISESRRKKLSDHIKLNHKWSLGIATVEEISELNILKASLLAMKRAILGLNINLGTVLVDGNQKIPNLGSDFIQKTIIKGDLLASPIAAASIVAKVARDEWMNQQVQLYPEYKFEKHKGYGTALHLSAIKTHGPCPIHRPTFAGVKEYLI